MSERERLLAIIVAATLVLAVGWAAVKWGVVERWDGLKQDIAQAEHRTEKLRHRLEQARTAEARWTALLPLSQNPHRGEQRFRRDVSELLEQHGLGEDLAIRSLPQRRLKSDFTEVRLSIQTRGTLQEITNFLCDYYRRDYLTKLDQISLTAEERGRRSRSLYRGRGRVGGRRGSNAGGQQDVPPYGPEGPRLNISMTASALVLPQIRVGDKVLEQDVAGDIAPPDPNDSGRLLHAPAEYAEVWETNLFKLWQPAPVVTRTEPRARAAEPTVVEAPKVKPHTPPKPRPPQKLVGVTSTLGELAAYVDNEGRSDLAPERVRLNEAIDDGTLVLVHPQGIVVQVEEQRGGAFAFKYYLYLLGARFAEREELDPETYPEIKEELERALMP